MLTGIPRQLVVGRDHRRSKHWAGVAVALFAGSLLWFAAVKALDFPTVHDILWWEGYTLLLVGLVVLQAMHNKGILLSWALAFGAVVGLILNYGGVAMYTKPTLVEIIRIAILGGVVAALSVGTVGFLIGVIARRVVESWISNT
ncbi:MAG: hypothetical protein ABEI52_07520 [Halobacteriaceae archaeon]